MPLQIRRGSTTERLTITPLAGELVYDSEENLLYIGDNSTPGGITTGSISDDAVKDISGSMFETGTHSNIDFVYDEVGKTISASVDLTDFSGSISATGGFKGSLFAYDNDLLVDATLKSFQLNGTVRTNIVPFSDASYDLGDNTNRFKDLYLRGNNIYLNAALINSSGSTINLPTGSTVGGEIINSGSGVIPGGSYDINVLDFSGDRIVDSSESSITALGGIYGDLTGSVLDQTSTILVDAVSGIVFADVDNNTIKSTSLVLSTLGNGAGIKIVNNSPNVDYDIFSIESANNTPIANSSLFVTGSNTVENPGPLVANQRVFNFVWGGYDNSSNFSMLADIQVSVDGNNQTSTTPGRFEISTNDPTGVMRTGLIIGSDQIISLNDRNLVVAGSGSGQVNNSGPTAFVKIKVGSTLYAMPLYAINP